MTTLNGKHILIVGGASGIGRRIADDARALGARVTTAGRDRAKSDVRIDLGDESSIADAAAELGPVDHIISLAANHANGPVKSLTRDAISGAFDAKVVGPLLLAKHFGDNIAADGSIVLFSGVAAWKPAPGLAVMATTNGAVAFLAEALAVELAPVRVNAVSPGIVDSGAWDGLEDKSRFLADTAENNPARRVGDPSDVSSAVLMMLTNPFVTGTTLHVDGGGRLS